MKKYRLYLLALTLAFVTSNTFAQQVETNEPDILIKKENRTGLFITAKLMPQMGWMPNRDDVNNRDYETLTRYGVAMGIGGGYVVDDNTALEMDLLYSAQGAHYRLNDVEYHQRLDYLKAPLLLVVNTNPSRYMLFGKIGPQLSLRSLSEIDRTGPTDEATADNRERFNDFVLDGVICTGGRWAVNKNISVDVAIRMDFSLTNPENKNYSGYPSGRAVTHNLTTGIEFGFNYLIPHTGLSEIMNVTPDY